MREFVATTPEELRLRYIIPRHDQAEGLRERARMLLDLVRWRARARGSERAIWPVRAVGCQGGGGRGTGSCTKCTPTSAIKSVRSGSKPEAPPVLPQATLPVSLVGLRVPSQDFDVGRCDLYYDATS